MCPLPFLYSGDRRQLRGHRRRVRLPPPPPLTGEATVTLEPLEMLARLCQHIPAPGMHLTWLYGTYDNRTRGARGQRQYRPRPEPHAQAPPPG
jgi:hypothetical protein